LDDNNKCVNKDSNFTDEYDSCHYNYLNAGEEINSDFCQLDSLYSSNPPVTGESRTQDMIQKMTPRQLLPCSALSTTEEDVNGCNNQNITNGKCFMDSGKCTYPKTLDEINRIVTEVSNTEDENYQKIEEIDDKLKEMNFISEQNKQRYIKESGEISGVIKRVSENSEGNQYLELDTDRIGNITKDDILKIKNSAGVVIYNVKVLQINIVTQHVFIEIIGGSIPNQKLNANLVQGAKWTLTEPNLGLFGSYQQIQAMIDSRRINDFYKTYL
jgi:hypothetical protein